MVLALDEVVLVVEVEVDGVDEVVVAGGGSWQSMSHPSPLVRLPSSHVSTGALIVPSPQYS